MGLLSLLLAGMRGGTFAALFTSAAQRGIWASLTAVILFLCSSPTSASSQNLTGVPPAAPMTHIFVYGTLKRGQPNHFRMMDAANGKAEYCGRGRTVQSFPLVIAGEHNIPFLLNVPGSGRRVKGEVYRVDGPMLAFLDEFEGCPHMYQRTPVALELEEWTAEGRGVAEAFIYSTTTYRAEWLKRPVFDDYDAYGDHGLVYVDRESRD
ncbi:hypothetical protein AAFF_G00384890 [Aldrovandia affinis]|uniref:Gamma-glutamylaminecyclotransferase n=1 Tax=Aldrovandia affinis TaxID=143900 RepID=A0AAD7SF12_9TELE|nr:hypothetical protein AAFF_G00384890 [Aldrovandia affinis]